LPRRSIWRVCAGQLMRLGPHRPRESRHTRLMLAAGSPAVGSRRQTAVAAGNCSVKAVGNCREAVDNLPTVGQAVAQSSAHSFCRAEFAGCSAAYATRVMPPTEGYQRKLRVVVA